MMMLLLMLWNRMLHSVDGRFVIGSGEVSRRLTGDFISQYYHRERRDDVQGEKGFRPLAAMMLYMQGELRNRRDPSTHKQFEDKLQALEQKYTSYGCYCWIDGVDVGVVGGGKTRDVTDHHCKELYQCYKCVNADYAKNYTDVGYTVDFTMVEDDTGKMRRALECQGNSKQDASNVCECDKRFAEAISVVEDGCDANQSNDKMFGSYCMDETYRTTNAGGLFDPHKSESCDKQHKGLDRNKCCGTYPSRYPYDMNFKDCCQRNRVDEAGDSFKTVELHGKGQCEGLGGTIVVSEAGNPHSYVAVNSLKPESSD